MGRPPKCLRYLRMSPDVLGSVNVLLCRKPWRPDALVPAGNFIRIMARRRLIPSAAPVIRMRWLFLQMAFLTDFYFFVWRFEPLCLFVGRHRLTPTGSCGNSRRLQLHNPASPVRRLLFDCINIWCQQSSVCGFVFPPLHGPFLASAFRPQRINISAFCPFTKKSELSEKSVRFGFDCRRIE